MGWNHRILVTFDKNNEPYLQIHEVYYENNIPTSYTKESISVGAETLKGMKWVLKHMKKCLKKPILYEADRFPEEYKIIKK